jgi:hypothetical protein
MPDIPASEPIVIPAKPEIVCDKFGVEKLVFEWPNLTGSLLCDAKFRSAYRDENSTLVAGPVSKPYSIPDLWERMAVNPKMAQAFGLIMEVLTEEAMKDGAI